MSDAVSENEQILERRRKLAELRKQNKTAFRNDFKREHYHADLKVQFDAESKESLEASASAVSVAGRIMTRRLMGKASFCHLQDMTGQIQLYLKKDQLPDGQYEQFKSFDLGDIVGVKGVLFKTKVGELSVKVTQIELLTKALRPLPEKFHGLTNVETRYRQRYLDLISNEESRKVFLLRSKIVSCIREFLIHQHFLEVETPMMHPLVGGAAAKPFSTHHNALDMPLYLRIAPELYLKRLVVGGFERVFEINRNFRNEGLSTRHNPEFTMLEFYQAYATYQDLMSLTEQMVRHICHTVFGTAEIVSQGVNYDFSQPFIRMTVVEAILKHNPELTEVMLQDFDQAKAYAEKLGLSFKKTDGLGKIQIEIFEKTAEHQAIQPTFITAYPAEVSPLARRNDDNPFVTDRFEFFVGGQEIANGFSELNDAEDQAERFQQQVKAKDAGDDEAMHYDADYITALEHGLPPTAGEGIGIDRLVMLLTDSASIRDVILFPQMRRF